MYSKISSHLVESLITFFPNVPSHFHEYLMRFFRISHYIFSNFSLHFFEFIITFFQISHHSFSNVSSVISLIFIVKSSTCWYKFSLWSISSVWLISSFYFCYYGFFSLSSDYFLSFIAKISDS